MKSLNYSNRPYEKTKQGLVYRIFYDQIKNSKSRGHTLPSYTKEELKNWIFNQLNFSNLFLLWEESNYSSDLRPSCDRLNNNLGYTFTNIELVTWAENKKRANNDTIKGILGSSKKEVYQYNENGSFKAKYISVNEAALSEDGLDARNIATCARGLLNYAYRYHWTYINKGPIISLRPTRVYYDKEIVKYDPVTGDINYIYSNLKEVYTDVKNQTALRIAIKNNSLHKKKFFSFEYLSPETVKTKTIKLLRNQGVITIRSNLDGSSIKEYATVTAAAKGLNLRASSVHRAASKNKAYKGYLWKFKPI